MVARRCKKKEFLVSMSEALEKRYHIGHGENKLHGHHSRLAEGFVSSFGLIASCLLIELL